MAKVNYKEFLEKFEIAGLTHKEFGKREGISPHMVSYYLKRARDERDVNDGFAQIEVKKPVQRAIRITSPGGVIIEIPV